MNQPKRYIVFLLFLCLQKQIVAQTPQLFLQDATKVAAKKSAAFKDTKIKEQIAQLAKQADKLLDKKIGSVMDKNVLPPCGNKHEYLSLARYYWPDPSKSDGKPYIKKDGEKNPDNDLISDDKNFDDLIATVNNLSWAYYFTNENKYAEKAIQLIRFWFLDTSTMMSPNLNHAQVRTGIDTGASTGIIDTHNLPQMLDAIGLLSSSSIWKSTDEKGIKQWFSKYLDWLLNSYNGKKEREAKNNHGTFYDMQVASIALFCGEKKVADDILKNDFKRLAWQIEIDGKQPLELARTLALGYSTFNLDAWFRLANIAEKIGVNFWQYETKDGRSLKKALDYLIPFTLEGKPFDYKQINKYKTQDLYRLLLIAADKFKDDNYKKQAEKIKDSNKNSLVDLLNA